MRTREDLELEELAEELGYDRDVLDCVADICAACSLAGMSDEEISVHVKGWLRSEGMRRRGAAGPMRVH